MHLGQQQQHRFTHTVKVLKKNFLRDDRGTERGERSAYWKEDITFGNNVLVLQAPQV